jgi:hypothetical protein
MGQADETERCENKKTQKNVPRYCDSKARRKHDNK